MLAPQRVCLLALLGLFLSLAGSSQAIPAAAGPVDLYVQSVNGFPVGATHPVSSVDPVYLGVSESAAGPFDPMYQMQFMRGFTYRVHNVDTTYSVGISSDDGTTMVVAAVGPGATLTVVANTLTAGVYSYQDSTETDMGFQVLVRDCVNVPPSAPVLDFPVTDFDVFTNLINWKPTDPGINCANLAQTPGYVLFVKSDTSPDIYNDSSIELTTLNVANGRTYTSPNGQVRQGGFNYTVGLQAVTGAGSAFATPVEFTTAVRINNGFTRLRNNKPAAGRSTARNSEISNEVVNFYFEIEDGGGTLTITAGGTRWQTYGAPASSNVLVYARLNEDPANLVGATSTSSNTFKADDVTASSQVLIIPNASAGTYSVGVSVSGDGAFSVVASYSCGSDQYLDGSWYTTACASCPLNSNTVTPLAFTEDDCICEKGFFTNGTQCSTCPEGSVCDGRNRPTGQLGFWSSAGDNGAVWYKCPLPLACLGGLVSEDGSSCREGYGGALCSVCAEDYYKLGGQCYACPSAAGLNFAAGLIILILFVIVSFELARFFRKVSSVTVVISFIQVIAIFSRLQLNWPNYLNVIFNSASGLNLNPELAAHQCVNSESTWKGRWLWTQWVPILLFLAAVFFSLIGWAVSAIHKAATDPSEPLKKLVGANIFVPMIVTVLQFLYIPASSGAIGFFDCTAQPDGSATLDASADITCYTGEWSSLLPLAVFFVFVNVIGVPVIFAAWLVIRSHKLYDTGVTADRMYKWLGPLYLRYRFKFFWWELVNFTRKAVLIFIASFFTTFPLLQAVLAIGLLTLSLVLVVVARPYFFEATNTLEAFLMFVQIVYLLAGLLFFNNQFPQDLGMQRLIFAVLAILLILSIVFGVAVFVMEVRVAYKKVEDHEYESHLKTIHENKAKIHERPINEDPHERTPPDLDDQSDVLAESSV